MSDAFVGVIGVFKVCSNLVCITLLIATPISALIFFNFSFSKVTGSIFIKFGFLLNLENISYICARTMKNFAVFLLFPGLHNDVDVKKVCRRLRHFVALKCH